MNHSYVQQDVFEVLESISLAYSGLLDNPNFKPGYAARPFIITNV